jgi:hypothetical protein
MYPLMQKYNAMNATPEGGMGPLDVGHALSSLDQFTHGALGQFAQSVLGIKLPDVHDEAAQIEMVKKFYAQQVSQNGGNSTDAARAMLGSGTAGPLNLKAAAMELARNEIGQQRADAIKFKQWNQYRRDNPVRANAVGAYGQWAQDFDQNTNLDGLTADLATSKMAQNYQTELGAAYDKGDPAAIKEHDDFVRNKKMAIDAGFISAKAKGQ